MILFCRPDPRSPPELVRLVPPYAAARRRADPSGLPQQAHSPSPNMLYIGFRGMEGVHYASSHDSHSVLCGRLMASAEEDVLLPGATMPTLGGGAGIGGRVNGGLMGGALEQELAKILEEVRYIAKRFRNQDEDENVCNEWKFAAAVIDRLCLMAFSIFTILCTIGILMSAPNFVEAISKDFFA
ncbi:hypothetical protein M9458_049805 [Cirrhinus mrigala]|uniref:Neurotransmitter-gated ion-channel transmembrane domain-containing protein n=1 Tax=Cirrhinus mrigala TaxID=683832 RepID=A0ABD0N215_CIRMR